ncbi:MAG TPA: Ig-like domain-containing protein [Gemmatimonadaceae bacterium]|nr:Ig-like domain-containing protein [Gemmatimonadaceae bacterium]
MISLSSRACLVCAVAIMACSNGSTVPDDSIPGTLLKPAPVLTTLRVVPEMVAIQPGSTQQLSLSALDQSGAPIDVSGVTFSSDMAGVALVNDQGIVSGLASGVARITATVKVGIGAKTAQAIAFVRDSVAFPDVVLTYGSEGWSPYEARATAGSLIEWRFDPATSGSAAARILVKNGAGVVVDSVFLRGSPAFHQFTTPGTYVYCSGNCSTLQSGKVTVQ